MEIKYLKKLEKNKKSVVCRWILLGNMKEN
jgi:hypothetical protein